MYQVWLDALHVRSRRRALVSGPYPRRTRISKKGQGAMGITKHQRWTIRTVSTWKLIKDNQRHLPCHPSVAVRVKVLEPGIQSRWCDRCQTWQYFDLQPMTDERFPDTLRLRWLTKEEVMEHECSIDDDTWALTLDALKGMSDNKGET